MPQFDFFIWFSIALSTVATFQVLYYINLYYVLAPFATFQKTLIKLYTLKYIQQNIIKQPLFEYLVLFYFQKIKFKNAVEKKVISSGLLNKNLKIKKKANLFIQKKKNKVLLLKKKTKILILKKKYILFTKFETKIKSSFFANLMFSKRIIKKKKLKKKKTKRKAKKKLLKKIKKKKLKKK